MAIEVVDIPVGVALSIADLVTRGMPRNVHQSIARSSDYPVFKTADNGYVFLTYGEWLVIETRATIEDFRDWVGTHALLVKAVELTVIRHRFQEAEDEPT